METVNYTDQILERIIKILKAEFKESLKIYKTDRFDININQISIIESITDNVTTWSPYHLVDRIHFDLILRHKYVNDENKKEFLNRDFHRMVCSLLAYRSDSVTGWFNGLITHSETIEVEYDDNEKPKFFKKICNWSCVIAYDRRGTESTASEYLVSESGDVLTDESGEALVLE